MHPNEFCNCLDPRRMRVQRRDQQQIVATEGEPLLPEADSDLFERFQWDAAEAASPSPVSQGDA